MNDSIPKHSCTLEQLKTALASGGFFVEGLLESGKAPLAVLIHRLLNGACLAVFGDEKRAKQALRELTTFVSDGQIAYFPSLFTSDDPVPRNIHHQRATTLARLCHGENLLVVSSVATLRAPTPDPVVFMENIFKIAPGQSWDRKELIKKISQSSYEMVSHVSVLGEFSVRGSIIDLFVPLSPRPLRVEFCGDDIESIRFFDIETQRSQEGVASFYFSPAAEMVIDEADRELAGAAIKQRTQELAMNALEREKILVETSTRTWAELPANLLSFFMQKAGAGGTLLDFLTPDAALVFFDADFGADKTDEEAEAGVFSPSIRRNDKIILSSSEATPFSLEELASRRKVFFAAAPQENCPRLAVFNTPFIISRENRQDGIIEALARHIRQALESRCDVLYFCRGESERSRIKGLLENHALYPSTPVLSAAEIFLSPAQGNFFLLEGQLEESYFFQDRLLISDVSIFGKKPLLTPRRASAPQGVFLRSFSEIKEGDYLVHVQHGIGIYRGLQSLSIDGITNDFVLIEYLEGGRLYLPIYRLEMVQRYIGADGAKPKLDKLGSKSWDTAKKKAKEAIKEIAAGLVAVYAQRDVITRSPAEPLDEAYEEFCARFPYQETVDQIAAITEINADMDAYKPMDRLLCGDAGFGKTEVAVRAAYRAVNSGKQVVVMAPTTILSEQHFMTFAERFKDYPVLVERLNRLKDKKEQAKIVAAFNRGAIDILIGTHRVLQNDIAPSKLGLLIIDEEQSFGVVQKEKLKKLKTDIDVLTLSATPIPRTLHLSLVGIRDLSLINSPPADRLPIVANSFEFNEERVAEALSFELARGGQVFFVHDRIVSIYAAAKLIKRLKPSARIAVVHGKMAANDVETRMAMFVSKQLDVLVCTTIIAAGVDVPSANTIIVNRADRLGLAQLYQLRGRVGRSFVEGFAHFIIPKGATSDSHRRVAAVLNMPMRGAGLQISSYDLELRGAGNILGVSQSGHIAAIGYELYTQMMEEAVKELKREEVHANQESSPEINLGMEVYIPHSFIPDMAARIGVYKRLSLIVDNNELDGVREELRDMHGNLPEQVENLLAAVSFKNRLNCIGAGKLSYAKGVLKLVFSQERFPTKEKMLVLKKLFVGLKGEGGKNLLVPLSQTAGEGLRAEMNCVLDLLADRL